MKIKEIFSESFYDTLKTAGRIASAARGRTGKEQQEFQRALAKQPGIQTARPTPGPAQDIRQTLEPGKQYRFQNPDNPGTFIVVRPDGYFVDKLPKNLVGTVKRDRITGLFPVLRAENIQKYNAYYNQAADAGRVIEEPVHAL